ncbi:LacI family transcriptional regulator [Acidipropionibacterium jensenii]|uniref:LacI family DNA-binding transcriptional regulator n=1 Tax=Acidipropionibacterium jensenii TaxID=1749 RepID=UPI000BC2F46C|nr:LacI family DNA-binding transcriptional regulator [Acidipropionibacterium jensenii]AZZ41553.1 LacI family transcriptional regulator [Acidipropionibacterium jensenii]
MDGRRPTQVDVAKLAGVSRQTVSLVSLDDPRVSPASRAAVLEAMRELGYRPNVAARALAARRTGFVGIATSELVNPFHGELLEMIRRHCETQGLVPFIVPVGQDPADERLAVERFLQMNVDALILISPLLDGAELDRIGRQLPTVVVTRNLGPASVDLVHTDDVLGARLVAGQLLGAGYRPLVYLAVDRPVAGDSSRARIRGYRSACEEGGIGTRVEMVRHELLGQVISRTVERYGHNFGLCCHNDLIALASVGQLAVHGLEPGRDVGVAGFDNTTISGYPGVSLTSVDQGTQTMARRVVELVAERLAGRTGRIDVVLPPRLVVRSSTTR